MKGRRLDIAIAGGGLSGGLIALALARARPDLAVALVEGGAVLGGNHRWSWFASDLSPDADAMLARFRCTRWDGGYDVRFPGHSRTLSTGYRSLASADFDEGLRRELPEGTIRTGRPIAAVDATGLSLADGSRIDARTVIDCRGVEAAPQLLGGWQVFMGRHIATDRPHGVSRPVIMDALVEQPGAYRFVYVLPLGAHEIFVEDTYYADSPALDRSALSGRIDAYCRERGWEGRILGHETGVLPVITGGDFDAFQAAHAIAGVGMAGARGGFTQPLTSYTMPFAADTALAIAADADLPGEQMAAMLAARARQHWSDMVFYRRLGAMLFGAGVPEQRWRMFDRFYRMREPLVERFYSGNSTARDRLRILCGRPPVPISGALRALTSRGRPLERITA